MYYEVCSKPVREGHVVNLLSLLRLRRASAAALTSRKRRSAFLPPLQSWFYIPRRRRRESVLKMMELEGLNFYLDGVTNFTFCLIGMTVNAAAIGMLCRQKTTSIFVKLMISLVTYDLIYVFLSATCFSLPRLSTTFDGKKTDAFFHSIPNSFPVFVFFFSSPRKKKSSKISFFFPVWQIFS